MFRWHITEMADDRWYRRELGERRGRMRWTRVRWSLVEMRGRRGSDCGCRTLFTVVRLARPVLLQGGVR